MEDLAPNLWELDSFDGELPSQKAMCLLWSTDDNILRIRVNNEESPPMKRGVLQKTLLNFDPIGFSAPFLLGGKQVFQELCAIKGLGWDDEIPHEIHKKMEQVAGNFRRHNPKFPTKIILGPRCTVRDSH